MKPLCQEEIVADNELKAWLGAMELELLGTINPKPLNPQPLNP